MNPKNYPIFMIYLLFGLCSCQQAIEPLVENEKTHSEVIIPIINLPNDLDENLLQTAILFDSTLIFRPLNYDTIKIAYQTAEEKQKRYVDDVNLVSFEGGLVEMAALELFQKGDWVQIHIDYYNGEPIGCKRFFVFKKQLVAVEHIRLEEVVNESGNRIEEQVTQINYYQQDRLLQTKYLTEVVDKNRNWEGEQKVDWQIIQQYL